jgi:hypothetical protein
MIDHKGLSDEQVQRAIDSYISQERYALLRREAELKNDERIAKMRVEQGKRLRLMNAFKRNKVSVKTDSYYFGSVSIGRRPSTDGWYNIHIESRLKYGTPQEDIDKFVESILAKIKAIPEVEVSIDTENPDYTKYYARLANTEVI